MKGDNIEYEEVSLFKNPITVLSTLFVLIFEQIVVFLEFLRRNKILIIGILTYIALNFIEGLHASVNFC
jgi:hypothetical protein